MEVTVAGKKYRVARKLNAFEQADLTRKLLPILGGVMTAVVKSDESLSAIPDDNVFALVMGPASAQIAGMPDADFHFILNLCLGTVERQVTPEAWSPILAPGGRQLMHDDIELPQMIRLVLFVVKENLGRFFQGAAKGV